MLSEPQVVLEGAAILIVSPKERFANFAYSPHNSCQEKVQVHYRVVHEIRSLRLATLFDIEEHVRRNRPSRAGEAKKCRMMNEDKIVQGPGSRKV